MGKLIMEKWNTSIKELLLNYMGALQAIIPWLEKSRIPYLEGESYDEWDAITSTLYELSFFFYCPLSVTNIRIS